VEPRYHRSTTLLQLILVEEIGHAHYGNAFFSEFVALVSCSRAANRTRLSVTLMHASGFLGKARANVFGTFHHLANLLQHSGLKFGHIDLRVGGTWRTGLIRGDHTALFTCRRVQMRYVQTGRRQALGDSCVTAHRAAKETACLLAIVIVVRRKPTLKHMAVLTFQIEYFEAHAFNMEAGGQKINSLRGSTSQTCLL
jgi:hypothetical protein